MKKNQQSVEGEAGEREEGNLGVWGEEPREKQFQGGSGDQLCHMVLNMQNR